MSTSRNSVSKLTLPGSDFNSANRFLPLANGMAPTATRLFNRSTDSSLSRETVRSQNYFSKLARADPISRSIRPGVVGSIRSARQRLPQLLVAQLHRAHFGRQSTGELVLDTDAELTEAVHRTDLPAVILRRPARPRIHGELGRIDL
ncbi:hypothetical protein [Nocardia gipuzkoensis]